MNNISDIVFYKIDVSFQWLKNPFCDRMIIFFLVNVSPIIMYLKCLYRWFGEYLSMLFFICEMLSL